MRELRFDVYGREVLIERTQEHWSAYYIGADGKRRSAKDIVIPTSIGEADRERYLPDVCDEWAIEQHPHVRLLS